METSLKSPPGWDMGGGWPRVLLPGIFMCLCRHEGEQFMLQP